MIITGGHTIQGAEPIYGLAVSGFVHPQRVLTNSGAKPGDILILTKPLGIGILTTAAKADLVDMDVLERIYRQMATLNKAARDVMVRHQAHCCTDVTGFGLLGHCCEMAQGSGMSIHLNTRDIPFHPEALEMAQMGFIPAGAYRNRDFAQSHIHVCGDVSRAMQDICYDPQTSGGLLMAIPEAEAAACLCELHEHIPSAAIIGCVCQCGDAAIYLE